MGAPRPTGPSSAKRQPTPTSVDGFVLSGRSNPPDPDFHAFRKDLADAALAGRVIASHYADPLKRAIATATELRRGPSSTEEVICELKAGDVFALLDDSLGWAWGYAGEQRRVGYIVSEALGRSVNN